MTRTKVILVNEKLCSGCRICELACSFRKENEFNPKKARIRVANRLEEGLSIPRLCRQCEKPLCVEACVSNALTKDAVTGVVRLDERLCSGCEECVTACPFGGIVINKEERLAMKCDQCNGSPECVHMCPMRALKYVNRK